MGRSGALGWVAAVSLATIVLAMGGAGPVRAEDAPAAGAKRLTYAAPCRSLDPAKIGGPDEERVVLACFEGLTRLDPETGKIEPGAAASWDVSPDGRTWTFHLRDAMWFHRFGDAFKDKGPVKATDFVYAWRRLLDPDTASPHLHALDAIPGVLVLSTIKPRAVALDRVSSDLLEAIGGEKQKKTLSPDDVQAFLNDTERNARGWLGEVDAKEAKELATWPADKPYQGQRAWALLQVLRKELDRLNTDVRDAEEHVGKDRSFWAKDDKTLVVTTAGPAPWLPSLLARGPLAPVHEKWVSNKRDQAFNKSQNQVCNGAFVSFTDFPLKATNESGEATPFKVVLFKNPAWWRASSVGLDQVVALVDNGPDEVLRQYGTGACQWVHADALTPDISRGIRAAKAPGWKPAKDTEKIYASLAGDAYDVTSGRVAILRFRCAGPLEKKEARQALAALVAKDAVAAKAVSAVTPPVARRFVPPGTSGMADLPRTLSVDASKAAALYGKRRFPDGSWLTIVADATFEGAADAIGKTWKAKVGDDYSYVQKIGSDLSIAVDAGLWDALLQTWIADYDDPLAFLSAFTTKNPAGDCAWSSPLYDALIAGAKDVAGFKAKPDAAVAALPTVKPVLDKATDAAGLETLRRTLLAEAEAMLLEEAVVVPLWHPVDSGLVGRTVKGIFTGGGDRRRSILDPQLLTGVGRTD